MSEPSFPSNPDQEKYAYSVTRKLFWYTALGTAAFSGLMTALWYVF